MRCCFCRKNYDIKDLKPLPDGRAVCKDCTEKEEFKQHYVVCRYCGKLRVVGMLCSCDNFNAAASQLMSYSYKPQSIYRNNNPELDGFALKGERYYGMEMEYSYVHDKMFTGSRPGYKKLEDIAHRGDIYYKRDSSLENGVEFVTGILTKKRMLKLIDEIDGTGIFKSIRKVNYKCGAGIHIHVSRDSISPIDIYKLSILFNKSTRDDIENSIFFYITGRDEKYKESTDHTYCSRGTLNGYRFRNESEAPRHIALNLRNSKTIEFRMFKTSVYPNTIKSYIEFVDLAIKFVESTGINHCTMGNFISYLKDNAKNIVTKRKLNVVKDDAKTLQKIWVDDYSELYDKLDSMSWTKLYKVISLAKGNTNKNVLLDIVDKVSNNRTPANSMTGLKLGTDHPVYRYIEKSIMAGICSK